MLDDLIGLLNRLPDDKVRELQQTVEKADLKRWVPNPGPQTEAYDCGADQLLYGGAAGGGKSQLLLGLAFQEHRRSLILRRMNVEVDGLVDDAEAMVGDKDGYNGQKHRWYTKDGRLVQFGGCQHSGDERKYKGQAKDFIGVDEATEFLESQIDYVINWLRTGDPNQRVRLVLATNPPTTAAGEWVTRWFAPWVDPAHHMYPTPSGKLLYFVRDLDTFQFFETEAEGYAFMENMKAPPPRLPSGDFPRPLTRTFIKSKLEDNPDYARTDYAARLAQMPAALRRRYMEGDFTAAGDDDEWQIISTQWILDAQQRWRESGGEPPASVAMTAMGVDVAQGGADNTVLSVRYGAWFAPLLVVSGRDTPENADTAALVVKHRRDQSAVVVDVGGGYGGGVVEFLKGNNIQAIRFNGANASGAKTADKSLDFTNKRAEAIWRLREALDPSQHGGSRVALPDDGTLRADLASYRWKLTPNGIRVEDKEEIKKRIGRSPDRGDAVMMCWSEGQEALRRGIIGPGARAGSYADRPAFASVKPGPLTRHGRYGRSGD